MTGDGWVVLAASEKGSAHGADATNQDAYGSRQLRLGGQPATVAAVSDGHGGRRYVRSATGSRLAVDVALDVLARAAAEAPDPARLLHDAVPTIVSTWRDRVRQHAGTHPFTSDEVDTAGVALDPDPETAYGATLLITLAGRDALTFAQLGDGDIVVRCGTGVRRPMPEDARLVAGSTTSLCLPTAVADFRFGSIGAADRPDLVLLASDGYGNAFADPRWHEAVVSDLGQQLDDAGAAEVGRRLPNWLTESALVGGDDVTVVLLARRPPAAAAPLPATAATTLGATVPAASAGGVRTRRGIVIGALAALTLLGATGVTYALTRSTADPVVDPVPVESHAPGPVGPRSTATKVASPSPSPSPRPSASPSPAAQPSVRPSTPTTVVQGPGVHAPQPAPPASTAPSPSPSQPRPTHRASAPASPTQPSALPSPSTPEQSPAGPTSPSPRGTNP